MYKFFFQLILRHNLILTLNVHRLIDAAFIGFFPWSHLILKSKCGQLLLLDHAIHQRVIKYHKFSSNSSLCGMNSVFCPFLRCNLRLAPIAYWFIEEMLKRNSFRDPFYLKVKIVSYVLHSIFSYVAFSYAAKGFEIDYIKIVNFSMFSMKMLFTMFGRYLVYIYIYIGAISVDWSHRNKKGKSLTLVILLTPFS